MIKCFNNNGRLQDVILLFQIPMGTRKDFFEIYRQFGQAPSKRFGSPALQRCGDCRLQYLPVSPKYAYVQGVECRTVYSPISPVLCCSLISHFFAVHKHCRVTYSCNFFK